MLELSALIHRESAVEPARRASRLNRLLTLALVAGSLFALTACSKDSKAQATPLPSTRLPSAPELIVPPLSATTEHLQDVGLDPLIPASTTSPILPSSAEVALVDTSGNADPNGKNSNPQIQLETTKVDTETSISIRHYRLVLKNHLPVRIELSSGEVIHEFTDTQELQKLRETAMSTGIYQGVGFYPIPEAQHTEVVEEKNKQLYTELPPGTLTTEQLQQRGVEIINTPEVTLHLRESAFSENGPLSGLAQTGKQLKLVLVDGPVISTVFMQDERYDGVRHLLGQSVPDVTQRRQLTITTNQTQFDTALAQLETTLDAMQRQRLNDELMRTQRKIWEYAAKPDSEIGLEMVGSIRGGHTTTNSHIVIFLPAGRLSSTASLFLHYDAVGNLIPVPVDSYHVGSADLRPSPQEAQHDYSGDVYAPPDPDSPGNYAFGGSNGFGWTLYHELAHIYTTDLMLKPIYSSDWQRILGMEPNLIGGRPFPNYSEYDTDRVGRWYQRQAWDAWSNSGFTIDDFPFVTISPLTQGQYITF